MAISIDLAIGSVATSGGGGGGSVNTGVLQVSGGGALSGTLQTITDQSSNASPLQLSTTSVNFTEQVTLTKSGGVFAVGIAGFSRFVGFTADNDSALVYNASNGLRIATVANVSMGGFSERARFDNNGNFVLGTTAASARLHVRAAAASLAGRFEDSAGVRILEIGNGGYNIILGNNNDRLTSSSNSGYFDFNTNANGFDFNKQNAYTGSGTVGAIRTFYTINNHAGTVNGIFLNATETSLTGTTHNLMDLQGGDTGGLSVFRVSKNRVSSARFETIVRLGGGSDTAQHYIYGGEGNSTGIVLNRANGAVGLFGSTGVLIGDSTFAASGGASARLHVRGDGTNPIARFEDNAGTPMLRVENSLMRFGASTPFGSLQFAMTGTTIGGNNNGTGLGFYSQNGNANDSDRYDFGFGGEPIANTAGTVSHLALVRNFAAGAGSANYRPLNIAYTINNSGAQTGTATGIFLNATETALNGMTHNLMDLQVGGVSRFSVANNGITSLPLLNIIGGGAVLGQFTAASNGVLRISNGAGTDFNRLQFGGTTNAFPAIKRNGAAIDFRLADDSSYANINTGQIFGYTAGGSPIVRFKLGEISGGQGISTREGQFSIGFTDASQNSGVRFLPVGSGVSYIDGWSEGTSKAANYRMVFGSRVNNTGTSITGSTTAENGTPFVFGFDVHDASAIVQINSTTRGFLPPRMTTTEVNAIVTPAEGLVVYNTTISHLCVYAAGTWHKLSQSTM